MLYHASFPWSQNELAAPASSSDNASSRHLRSQTKTDALNPHHRHCLSSPDSPTSTIHYYKNIISTLVTLPTTQPRLHFTSSLARAPHHRSSTHVVVPFHCRSTPIVSPHNDTHDDELADSLLFPEQLTGI
jgi:hypothetical protein